MSCLLREREIADPNSEEIRGPNLTEDIRKARIKSEQVSSSAASAVRVIALTTIPNRCDIVSFYTRMVLRLHFRDAATNSEKASRG